ncbi:Cytosolic carboxypeptidase 2 [Rhizophlyctis rosea]|nr:Cytosolic carboxypeptidase 2 [Rhizophlyctis rosea]
MSTFLSSRLNNLTPEPDIRPSTGFSTTILRSRSRPTPSITPTLVSPRPLAHAKNEMPPPRWPVDMKALTTPSLIDGLPPKRKREPLTTVPNDIKRSAGLRPAPKRIRMGFVPTVVFEAKHDDAPMKPYYQLKSAEDTTLLFESRFESGNLQEAVRVDTFEYDLKVRQDTNTRGHTQWFFFRLHNVVPSQPYCFNITNLMKPDSLYNYGMQPLMYSERAAELDGVGWHRVGTDISYYRSADESAYAQRALHTLTFSITFEYARDTVYFAHCYPYTYSDLQRYLYNLKQDPVRSTLFRHRILCHSLGGNNLDLLTLTTPVQTPQDLARRKGIIISARVHPGETNSSYMLKGLLDFLLSSCPASTYLLDNFVIKIVPMLNPDGVIVGNHRCNLLGWDLNRQWGMDEDGGSGGSRKSGAGREEAPEIWSIKEMIRKSAESREIVLYCDLHGHNRRHGIFMYGCHNDDNDERRYKERVFPYLLSKNAPSLFFFKRCQFKIQRAKEGTARIQVWRQLNLINSFTMEASFCGSDQGPDGGFHYGIEDLEDMGRKFGETLFAYFSVEEEEKGEAVQGGEFGLGGLGKGRKDDAKAVIGEGVSRVAKEIYGELCQEFQKGSEDVIPEEDGDGEDDTSSDDEVMRIPLKKKKIRTKKRIEGRSLSVGPSSSASRSSGSGKSSPRVGVEAKEKGRIKSVARVSVERKSVGEGSGARKVGLITLQEQIDVALAPLQVRPVPPPRLLLPRSHFLEQWQTPTPAAQPFLVGATLSLQDKSVASSTRGAGVVGVGVVVTGHDGLLDPAGGEKHNEKETVGVKEEGTPIERKDSAVDLMNVPNIIAMQPGAVGGAEPVIGRKCSLHVGVGKRGSGNVRKMGRVRSGAGSLWYNAGDGEETMGMGKAGKRNVIEVPVALPINE